MRECDIVVTSANFTIELVDGAAMKCRWNEIEAALRLAFEHAEFVEDGDTVERPIQQTLNGVEGRIRTGTKHLLVVSDLDEVLGGCFNISTQRRADETDIDVGWIFVVPTTDRRTRLTIFDALIERVTNVLRETGWQRVETAIGTRAGAQALCRRYGMVHSPAKDSPNRWVKEL